MKFRTKFIFGLPVVLLTAGLILLEPAQPTLATPGLGADCLQCHSAMPPTKANVKASQPSAEAKAPAAQPSAETKAPAQQPAAKKQPATPKPAAETTNKTVSNLTGKNVTVTAYVLNVRAAGSVKAAVIAAVKKNTVLTVLKQQSGWLQIKYDGGTGWVYGKYVALSTGQPAGPKPQSTVGQAPQNSKKTSPAAENTPTMVKIPSINEQAMNSRLGSMHWNFFKENVSNPEDPTQDRCIGCHSAVRMVDDPEAKLTDFLRNGQKYATGEVTDPKTGETEFQYATATEDGKYLSNDLEGITCRVCHLMDKEGLTLRKPSDTCTQCHGRVFNWTTGSGHHVAQDFYVGHGETYYDPSVHYTMGMQCQDCHTMNTVKHDYEPAKPEDIVRNAKCQACHQNAGELEKIIENTQASVSSSLKEIKARLTAAEASIAAGKAADPEKLVAKAKARANFITSDLSNGVHNPQFAGKLINEANKYLDQFNGLAAASATPTVDLGNLSVYSQAQSSKLGTAHWDMLETNIFNTEDPSQDRCISCHSAVKIVDDPEAKLTDFLKAGTKYCTEELENPGPGQDPFVYSKAAEDGKYLKNYLEGITCRVCHTFEQPGKVSLRRSAEQTCGLCHGRSFNWNTGSGHHVELAFFKGQGSAEKAIPDMPSYKLQMGFACQDCHFMDNSKHDFEPATAAQIAANPKCSSCHTAESAAGMIEGIREETKTAIDKLKPRLETAKAYVDKNQANSAALETYTQAKAGVTFVEDDFSEGVHNPAFARYLLNRSDKLLSEFEANYK